MLNNNNEIWKDILGYEKRYQISNTGKVRSIQDNHGNYREQERKAYVRSTSCPYLYVQMWVKDKGFTHAVHRLVAETFIKNPDNKPMVNHIDGNKRNNNAYNLEWVTCSENHKHAFKTGLRDKEQVRKRMIGTKFNARSVYKNVSWDSNRHKWIGCVKHKGKPINSKRFNTEIEAAQHVNWIIDTYALDRPKNVII